MKLRGPDMASFDSVCGVECLTWRSNGSERTGKAVNNRDGMYIVYCIRGNLGENI